MMMRTKAAQLRWMKQLQAWAAEREKEANTLKLCDSPAKGGGGAESKFGGDGGGEAEGCGREEQKAADDAAGGK